MLTLAGRVIWRKMDKCLIELLNSGDFVGCENDGDVHTYIYEVPVIVEERRVQGTVELRGSQDAVGMKNVGMPE